MPTSGGIWKALERGRDTGCEVVQLFVKNNMQWVGKDFPDKDLEKYHQLRQQLNFDSIFGHTGYLINLGAPDESENRSKSIQSLTQEIQLAARLQVPFLALHPGAHLGSGEDAGIQQIIQGLEEVFEATSDADVAIALENTAGQGTYLGGEIRHLASIIDGCSAKSKKRLGVCLDTAHFFAAGYDIRTAAGWKKATGEVGDMIGLDRILAFHLNDSKGDLGSHLDRHDHIGNGFLGEATFKRIVNDSRFAETPASLETPKSKDLHEDLENLAKLRSLVK